MVLLLLLLLLLFLLLFTAFFSFSCRIEISKLTCFFICCSFKHCASPKNTNLVSLSWLFTYLSKWYLRNSSMRLVWEFAESFVLVRLVVVWCGALVEFVLFIFKSVEGRRAAKKFKLEPLRVRYARMSSFSSFAGSTKPKYDITLRCRFLLEKVFFVLVFMLIQIQLIRRKRFKFSSAIQRKCLLLDYML